MKNINSIPPEYVKLQLENFRNAYQKFEKVSVEIVSVQHTKKKATVSSTVKYKAWIDGKVITMKGIAIFGLLKDEDGYWGISSISMPGLTI